jgi:hypothetical protein
LDVLSTGAGAKPVAGGGPALGLGAGDSGWRPATKIMMVNRSAAAMPPPTTRMRRSPRSASRSCDSCTTVAVGVCDARGGTDAVGGAVAAAAGRTGAGSAAMDGARTSGVRASARDSSSAVCQRSFGSLASAFMMICSSSSEIGAPNSRGDGGGVCR